MSQRERDGREALVIIELFSKRVKGKSPAKPGDYFNTKSSLLVLSTIAVPFFHVQTVRVSLRKTRFPAAAEGFIQRNFLVQLAQMRGNQRLLRSVKRTLGH